jgi:3-methylcrotonyl-CoA carboxylase alpha subunit
MHLVFRNAGQEQPVQVEATGGGWSVQAGPDGAATAVTRDGDGAWLVTTARGRRRCWVVDRGDERLVFCDGRVARLRLPDAEHEDDETDAGHGPRLTARMPGKIIRILVAPGDSVAAGQPLVIMESMKMETELAAGAAGVVQAVPVSEGQVVAQGDLLVDIAAAD